MSCTNRTGARLLQGVALACLAMTISPAQNSAPKKAPPKKAVAAFQQGLKAAQARKTEDARKNYESAVKLDAGYADAWYALAKLQEEQKELDAARASFEAAIRAEPARSEFYLDLATLEQRAGNWPGLSDIGDRLLKMNASDFPEAYLLSANGYYGAGKLDAAEKRAREGLQVDARQQFPKLRELLGCILVQRSNKAVGTEQTRLYAEAADQFRQYLRVAPATASTLEAREALRRLEVAMQGAGAAPPADATNGQHGVTIRTTTTMVQVGVIARDGKGRPVADLKKEDFEVLDNGKPQQISAFAVEKAERARARRPHEVLVLQYGPDGRLERRDSFFTCTNFALGEGDPISALAGRRPPPVAGECDNGPARGSYTAILVDWFNNGVQTTRRARAAAVRALEGLGSTSLVALYSLDSFGLHTISEFGSDLADLEKSIRTMEGVPSPCHALQLDARTSGRGPGVRPCDRDMPLEEVDRFMNQRNTETLTALHKLAARLGGLPGRKALVWVSAGIPLFAESAPAGEQLATPERNVNPSGNYAIPSPQAPIGPYGAGLEQALRSLNSAGVSVYPVDPREPTTVSASADKYQMTTPLMDEIASRTGGVAFHGRDDLYREIEAALEDSQITYLLGYYLPKDAPPDQTHILTVRVSRPGVRLRYREDYSSAQSDAGVPELRTAEFSQAAVAPVDSTAVPVEVTADRQQNAVTLRIKVDPAGLGLLNQNGRWKGAVDVATQFATAKGALSPVIDVQPVNLDLSEESYQAAGHDGLIFPKMLNIPAGADRVKVYVRSGVTGRVGSVTVLLRNIPEK